MAEGRFDRMAALYGVKATYALSRCRVAVLGLGGVGSYAVEALARSGVGALDLFDGDTVAVTNINRQLYALTSTIGLYKTDVAVRRVTDINPACRVTGHNIFYTPANAEAVDWRRFDYVVDCVDDVEAKIETACQCRQLGVPVISCMGAANKTNPMGFIVEDISRTKTDPLARTVRRRLRERGVTRLKVVYSEEKPRKPRDGALPPHTPASNAFVPAAAGLLAAATVITDLIDRYTTAQKARATTPTGENDGGDRTDREEPTTVSRHENGTDIKC